MQYLKRLFDFYIDASIHVALAVYCLSWLTLISFNKEYDENVLYFIFYATITGYNFVKYFGIAKFHHRSLTRELKIIQVFSFVCFVLMCYYFYHLQINSWYVIAGLGVVTFLYAIPFLPKRIFLDEAMNLRAISGLKIYVIAFVWSCVTVFLPLINADYNIDWDVIITAIQRFIYVLVVMLPFEIRDMRFDSVKLSTIPQQIGVKRTKIIGVLLLIPFFFLEFFKDDIQEGAIAILFLIQMLMIVSLLVSKTKQSKYFSSFWVESIPIIWLLIKLVGVIYL